MPTGLVVAMWGLLGLWIAAIWNCTSLVCGLLALPPLLLLVPFVGWWLFGRMLLAAALIHPSTRGKRAILIRSESPRWSGRIATVWLPAMTDRVFVLNWSERARWTNTLPVLVWKHFCGHDAKAGTFKDFNPALIVFRGLRHPSVFRCYPVFRAAGGGDFRPLEAMEKEMFRALDV